MPFSEIVGHDRIIEVFLRSLRNGKTAHSYLFEGVTGSGRRKTALALAQAMFCSFRQDGDSCGVCPSCRKVEAGNHPDIQIISPLPDKRDISIDQIRELQRVLWLRPYEAPRKVCIIDPAERMNANAANSLLKTLEEPPGDALIILISGQAGMLLPTVRSRCQLISFSPLSPENLILLLESKGMSHDAAALVAPMAGGSIEKALEFDNEALHTLRKSVLTALKRLDIGSIATIFDAAEELAGNRETTLELIDMIQSFYRDAVHLRTGLKDIVNSHLRIEIEALANRRSFEQNLHLLEHICDARQAVQRNANSKLAIENLFMKMAAV